MNTILFCLYFYILTFCTIWSFNKKIKICMLSLQKLYIFARIDMVKIWRGTDFARGERRFSKPVCDYIIAYSSYIFLLSYRYNIQEQFIIQIYSC